MTLGINDIPYTNLNHYAECHVLFAVMLSVILLNVVMLIVMAPSAKHTASENLKCQWPQRVSASPFLNHGAPLKGV
jgi:hypothetical protein